jgi:hypothetical protein
MYLCRTARLQLRALAALYCVWERHRPKPSRCSRCSYQHADSRRSLHASKERMEALAGPVLATYAQ